MTSDELKNAVSTVLEQPHYTQLYLILKINNELVMRLADIEDEETAPEIQNMFEGFLNTTIISNEDMVQTATFNGHQGHIIRPDRDIPGH